MKMEVFVVFLILVHVSQQALAVVVQAYEGEQSILLPYQYFKHHFAVPDDPIVSWNWSGSGLNLIIHQLNNEGDNLKEQNERYKRRTSMTSKALDSGDFSLTLEKPQISDSGNYTCTIWTGLKWLRLTEIQLQVKDDQEVVEVQEGAESVRLPCKTSPHLPEDTRVEWTYHDPVKMLVQVVRVYQNKSDDLRTHTSWAHTEMNTDLLTTGDLSLTIKDPTERDRGTYICTFYVKGDTMKQRVELHHGEPQHDHQGHFPKWAKAFLIFLFPALLIINGCLLFCFRPTSDKMELESGPEYIQLSCESGLEYIQLSCEATSKVKADAVRVKWTNSDNDIVYVYKRGLNVSDEPVYPLYKFRTQFNDDFSVTLKYPTDQDNSTYTCTIYSNDNKILLKKQVELKVKVCEVEGEEGAESVLLPFRTICDLPQDTEVAWICYANDKRMRLYVYQKDSVEPHQDYKTRTEMNENPLGSGDLGLILKHPKDTDSGKYRCHVRLNDHALTKNTVCLEVKGGTQSKKERVDMSTRRSSTNENHPVAEYSV